MSVWFKNLVVYRLPEDWQWSAAELEERLSRRRLRDCTSLEMFNRGWEPPAGPTSDDGRLVHTVNRRHLIALGTNQKLLPAAIVKQVAQERAKVLEGEQGHAVGRRQLREIKERVETELRARALTQRKTMRAWIDPDNGWLIVDSAGAPRAEELVETLRDTLDSLAVVPLDSDPSPQTAMGAWLAADAGPGRFSIDQDLELQAADKTKATVRYTRHPLQSREIKAHLTGGKFVAKLGLTWSDRLAFILTDKLHVQRVKFLELAPDAAATQGAEDIGAEEQFAADFALMTGELGTMLSELITALGIPRERRVAA